MGLLCSMVTAASEVLFSPTPAWLFGKGPASLDLKVCDPESRSERNAALGTLSLTYWNISPFIKLALSGLLTGRPFLFWRKTALLVRLESNWPEEGKIHETKTV